MPRTPKNIMSANEIFKSSQFSKNGKLNEIENEYLCDIYIQAMTTKETLKLITGKDYVITQNGLDGWKVVIKE